MNHKVHTEHLYHRGSIATHIQNYEAQTSTSFRLLMVAYLYYITCTR
jgi:hypothetical protein